MPRTCCSCRSTDARGEPIGYFSVDDPEDRLVPSQETIEAARGLRRTRGRRHRERPALPPAGAAHRRARGEPDRRMREMDEIKRQFVSAVSHELRTPLTAMRAHVDALAASGIRRSLRNRLETFVQVVDEESQRLARLVRVGARRRAVRGGQPKRAASPSSSRKSSEEAARNARADGRDRARWNSRCCEEVADTHLDADRDQLRQLVAHLGGNAMQVHLRGWTGRDREPEATTRSVTLQVEDTGIGIPGARSSGRSSIASTRVESSRCGGPEAPASASRSASRSSNGTAASWSA